LLFLLAGGPAGDGTVRRLAWQIAASNRVMLLHHSQLGDLAPICGIPSAVETLDHKPAS
jgi:hypothetical protein